MPDLLLAAAGLVLASVVAGLPRILRGPGVVDRIMAAQLLGTGGIAALLLAGVATATPAFVDAALVLALLAAFATIAMARSASRGDDAP
jgi:multicomponent Na+:H+ antiporter subunit F